MATTPTQHVTNQSPHTTNQKQGVSHTVALPFTLKGILRQKKKNYGNSNISSCKDIIFKKIL
jgi:hypothetical protein